MSELGDIYEDYIECLNGQDWERLGEFVHEDVVHNDRPLGLAGYRAMLEGDFDAIPDLRFTMELCVCEPPFVSSRLWFDCAPKGELFGLAVNGRRIRFAENVFYRFQAGRIVQVWSVIDKSAIEAQLVRAARPQQ
ncbi:ester cyclase [Falsochrobactrum shanghaiense]|uniref:Ester cyclase n=1 Tax=Falsochrobactrum shanghaiense TaxID=2201899 RepID=A0A316JIL8_9HYPH|nr:ester cyclase [Falsochrobactrum shanghaiense]PWL19103.1 ester cyclase [Falsochrobactrum shanghaiense]